MRVLGGFGYRTCGGEGLRRLPQHGVSGKDDHTHRQSEHTESACVQHSDQRA